MEGIFKEEDTINSEANLVRNPIAVDFVDFIFVVVKVVVADFNTVVDIRLAEEDY